DDIHEAGNVTFLGGNMGMAALHARLFRLTSEDEYRKRATRTVDALFNRLVNTNPVYINDRDAWTDGTFAGDWTREVLTLPGISSKHWNVFRTSGDAIFTKARTTNGYYGASWDGPADGSGSAWVRIGSTPHQIMTSASSVNLIVAAGFLESQSSTAASPGLTISHQPAAARLTVTGDKAWTYQVQSSPELTTWTEMINFVSFG